MQLNPDRVLPVQTAEKTYCGLTENLDNYLDNYRTCSKMNYNTEGGMFNRKESQAAYIVAGIPIFAGPPLLDPVVCLIATFGAFLARKGDGEPGVKTI